MTKNAIYAQSGGVTAVINASACAVLQTCRQNPNSINKVFAAQHGILGVLEENLIDTSLETEATIAALMNTPSGAFGSCRYKLKHDTAELSRIVDVFKAHNIGYFFYNGGGDSQDTALKIATFSQNIGYPIQCIGIPKTIDNDLPFTDASPGFGSVAKYVAISTLEAGFDVASMAATSTKVFILEVMGRHAGWIAAASALASPNRSQPPHLILLPEVTFQADLFIKAVDNIVKQQGYCVIVASEGIKNPDGSFLSESGARDAFGHAQLGGVAPKLAALIQQQLKLKHHWAVADYLQRSARHIASQVDLDQAYQLGKAAVELALQGFNAVMPIIVREQDSPYRWSLSHVDLASVANQEKKLPAEFIDVDGMGITEACRRYLEPLIQGEAYPAYAGGLPTYIKLNHQLLAKKLASRHAKSSANQEVV